jgi:hypothetical protein
VTNSLFSLRGVCSLALLLVISIPIQAQNASPDAQEENPARHLVMNGLIIKKPYRPIRAKERIQWELKGTLGPESLRRGVERRNGHGSESAQ